MNSKKMELGSKDLISSLPDALVCHILSFLSTKDAALTSVLAKRWRHLLAFVPNLEFDNSFPFKGKRNGRFMSKSFKLFVDRVLALQGNAPLNKFSLKCRVYCDSSRVHAWVLNVLDRRVLELCLDISSEYNYLLPSKVLMSKTLVKLKLAGTYEFIITVGEVFLPKLKTLYLDDVSFVDETGAAFAKLVNGCHALEELVMVNLKWDFYEFFSVSSPSLKRISIDCVNMDENPKSVSFDTPNLIYFEFTDTVAVKYPKANFVSLVEARLGLRMTPDQVFDARDSQNWYSSSDEDEEMVGNATDFFMGMSNVKILYLSSDTLEVLTFCCKAIPVFNNLIHLTVQTNQDVGWESLQILLENCPNLETLVFKGLHYRDTIQCEDERYKFKDTRKCYDVVDGDRCVCKPWGGTPVCLSSSPVKIVKILEFGEITYRSDDSDKQREMIKHFLEAMPNLEQVILYYDTPYDDDPRILSTELQKVEKLASPKCKIQVVSDYISFSSTVHSSSSTSGLVFFQNTFPV